MLGKASQEPLGWNIHQDAKKGLAQFSQHLEESYQWVAEALIEIKKTLAVPDIQLIPKTPSAKQAQRRRIAEEEVENAVQEKKTRARGKVTKGGKGVRRKLSSSLSSRDGDNSQVSESELDETQEQDTSTRSTRSTRNRTKAKGPERPTRSSRRKQQQDPEVPFSNEVDSSVSGLDEADGSGRPARATRGARAKAPAKATGGSGSRKKANDEDEESSAVNTTVVIEESIIEIDESLEADDVNTAEAKSTEPSQEKTYGKCQDIEMADDNGAAPASNKFTKSVTIATDAVEMMTVSDDESCPETPQAANPTESKLETIPDKNHQGTETPPQSVVNGTALTGTDNNAPQGSPPTALLLPSPSPLKAPGFRNLKVKEKVHAYEDFINQGLTKARVPSDAANKNCDSPILPRASRHTPVRGGHSVTPPTPANIKARATMTLSQPSSVTRKANDEATNRKAQAPTSISEGSPRPSRVASSVVITGRLGLQIGQSPQRCMSPLPIRSTRSKMRVPNKAEPQGQHGVQTLHTGSSPQNAPKDGSPGAPIRSTRSKLRHVDTDGGKEAEPLAPPPRVTRSKLRLHKPQAPLPMDDVDGAVDAAAANENAEAALQPDAPPIRVTRSKLRQKDPDAQNRQAPLKTKRPSFEHTEASPPKRQCLEANKDKEDLDSPQRAPTYCHSQSLLAGLNKGKKLTPNNMSTTITSFIQRNTPVKKATQQEEQEERRNKLLEKQKNKEDQIRKRQEYLRKRVEEQRHKREERQQLAARRREEQEKRDREAKKGIVDKLATCKKLTAKAHEEKLKEEREKQRQREAKMAEVEARRKQEEEARVQKQVELEQEKRRQDMLMSRKREFEEQERLRRIQEQRRIQEERQAEFEKDKQRELEKLRQQEEQKRREEAEKQKARDEKERRERTERERQDVERQNEKTKQRFLQLQQERARLREQQTKESVRKDKEDDRHTREEKRILSLIENHNKVLQQNTNLNTQSAQKAPQPVGMKPVGSKPTTLNTTATKEAEPLNGTFNKDQGPLNGTFNKEKPTATETNPDSYDLTPVRKTYTKKATAENYDIGDLHSDDSTDDDEAPRKKIPSWAVGNQLRAAIISQCMNPPDLDAIFDRIEMPDLSAMFVKKKPRFYKRTSSAIWHSPIYKPSGAE